MKFLRQKGDHCLACSAAMILDTTQENILAEIGHDGSEVWWPNLVGPCRTRGIHIREIINCVLSRGQGIVPLDMYPSTAPNSTTEPHPLWHSQEAVGRFHNQIKGYRAILVGVNSRGAGHACAWDGSKVYDPARGIYAIQEFNCRQAWILVRGLD